MARTRQMMTIANLIFAACIFTACGGGGEAAGDVLRASEVAPDLSVRRRLVADLSDASVLVDADYTFTQKETQGEGPPRDLAPQTTVSDERIDVILLEKITTDDRLEPAVYVVKETEVSLVIGGDSTGEATDEAVASGDDTGIILDDLITDISFVKTTIDGSVYFTLNRPLKYNGGKECIFFRISPDDEIACADPNLDNLRFIGKAYDGDIYYSAYAGGENSFRKISSDSRESLVLASYKEWNIYDEASETYDGNYFFHPSGKIFSYRTISSEDSPSKQYYDVKVISEDGIVSHTMNCDYHNNMTLYFLEDGGAILKYNYTVYDNEIGRYNDFTKYELCGFDGDERVTLYDSAENDLDLREFIHDDDGYLYFFASGEEDFDRIAVVKADEATELTMIDIGGRMTYASDGINNLTSVDYAENHNDVHRVKRLTFDGPNIGVEEVGSIPGIYSPPSSSLRLGKDGRLFFQFYLDTTYVGYFDEAGETRILPTISIYGTIHSLYPAR